MKPYMKEVLSCLDEIDVVCYALLIRNLVAIYFLLVTIPIKQCCENQTGSAGSIKN